MPIGEKFTVPKMNLKTKAYNDIREKIITCEYAPGTFLNEEFLTEKLGLSRTPVRDALSRLEQEGLVEIKSKKGIMITPLTISVLNMVHEIRILYEPYILLHYGNLISKDRLHEFYDIFMHKSPDSKYFQDINKFYEADNSFHFFLVNSCPNIYIQQNYNLIRTQTERLRYLTGKISHHRYHDTFQEHIDIIQNCLLENWEKATNCMVLHLEASKKASFQLIFDGMTQQDLSL